MTYRYCQEAKERVAALGNPAIIEFIEEIPHDIRKAVYDCLPKLSGGFRPGSTPEFKEKQRRIISGLAHPNGRGAAMDWKSFSMLWEGWARNRFGRGFPDGDGTEPDAEAGLAFLQKLRTQLGDVAREDVERLCAFSGFPDYPETAKMIGRFSLAADLARNRLVDSLPERLAGIERRLGATESAVKDAGDRMTATETAVVAVTSRLDEASASLDEVSKAVSEMEAGADASAAKLSRLESGMESLDASVRTAVAKLSELTARVAGLEGGFGTLADIPGDLQALKDGLAHLAGYEQDWVEAAEAIGKLSDQIAALESVLAGSAGGPAQRPRVRLMESLLDGPFIDISSVGDAVDVIAGNLQAAGVMKGGAQSAAREVAAALAAGQIVQFSGSLADFLADACAAAVGGPIYHEWRVPVGLTSDEAAADCIDAVAEKGPEGSGCLLLKGANLSAFEVYGPAIRDVVVRRQFFAAPPLGGLALLATWADGPAAFPNGGTLAELGPVLDTDTLAMRATSAKLPPIRFGRLARGSWADLDGEVPDLPPSMTLLLDILKEAGFDAGSLWRRTACRALAALRVVPGGREEGDVRSVIRSWALPWAKACGGDVEELVRVADRVLDDRSSDAAA